MPSTEQFTVQDFMQQARRMQEELVEAQSALSDMDVTGRAGADLVCITMSAGGEFRSVTIDPSAVDPHDVGALEALVLTALRNASAAIREAAEARLGPLTAGFEGLAR